MSGLIRPKIEPDQAFMPVLVTSNFDDDLIKNEWASMEMDKWTDESYIPLGINAGV